MRLLEFDHSASLASVIEAIKSVPEKEVTLRIPPETPWLKNPVNEKILVKSVQQFGKTVHFEGRSTPEVAPIKAPVDEAPAPEPPGKPTGPASRDEAGFVVGGDVMAETPEEVPTPRAEASLPIAPIAAAQASFAAAEAELGRGRKILKTLLRRWPFAIAGALVLLLALGAYVVLALPKADVKILVEQRPLEREATLTASTQVTKVDPDSRKIPAASKVATESGTSKTNTTGTKSVGTNAKGTISLYNGTDFDKSFPAGQKVTASVNGTSLKYTLDQAVTVPKRTGSLITGYTSGKADSAITATDIGPQYNIAASSNFTVDGYDASSFQGQNASSISGGSSRNVQVVAQADLDKLLSDLTSQLSDKAKTDVTSQGGPNDQIVDKALKTTVVSKTYDKKLGDEATDVSLNLTLGVTATVYSGQDLKDILSQTLQAAAPDGYEVSPDNQETSAELVKVEANGDLTFLGRIRANLIPKFDKDELARNLSGKKPQAAESYLQAIPSVVSYQVNIWPNLPDFFKSFPRDAKRIHIQVTVQ